MSQPSGGADCPETKIVERSTLKTDPDFVKKLAKRAENETKEMVTKLMERYFPTGKHKKVQGLNIVKWKPLLVPQLHWINEDGN